jgi:DNA-binding CsgD family transcriptional regulator
VTDLNSLPALHVTGRTANGVMACIALGLVLVLLVTQGRAFNSRIVRVADHDLAGLGQAIRIGLLADVCFVLLFASLALHESVAYPTAIESVTANEFVRFIELPFFLAAGLITDLVGRRPLLVASLVTAFVGATAPLAAGSQILLTLATGCAYFSIIAFPVACVALLSDALLYARNPALLGALAFAPIVVGELVAGGLGPLAERLDGDVVFVATVGVLALLTGLVTWLSSLLRRHLEPLSANVTLVPVDDPASPATAQVAVQFDFTPREREILDLSAEGLTVKQMATRLFLTEATIKFHITNMLKKTQSASRADLLAKLQGQPRR